MKNPQKHRIIQSISHQLLTLQTLKSPLCIGAMSRYIAAHAEPQGPGDARPTAFQIIEDEGMKDNLAGKVVVITGVSSGIGIETVRALATTGATLYLTARNLAKAETALAEFFDPSRMELVEMEQSSLESVRKAANTILSKTDKVNILINNAGIMAVPDLQHTIDGFELQFGTNFLSHFLFFEMLKPALLAATSPEFQSRVVNVASAGHKLCGINSSDNYNFQKGGYEAWTAYSQSKTASIYMANELERRYGSRGIHALSLNPGFIATGLGHFLSAEQIDQMVQNKEMMKIMKSLEQGAATTVLAAVGKEWEGTGGKYLSGCAEAERASDENDPSNEVYMSHAYSPEDEARLWKDSLEMVGLSDE
jgi:NAD(P)-dependent dehydrogenase (short-subunit alcohol dehydrogenase family)